MVCILSVPCTLYNARYYDLGERTNSSVNTHDNSRNINLKNGGSINITLNIKINIILTYPSIGSRTGWSTARRPPYFVVVVVVVVVVVISR